eukprot:SAG11_NODE_29284_length_312_cov_1.211268_1_plen_51_part_01
MQLLLLASTSSLVVAACSAEQSRPLLPNLLSIDWQRLPDLVNAQGHEGSGG